MKQSFKQSCNIWAQEDSDVITAKLSKELSHNIQPLLRSVKPDLDPIVVVGRNLASYNSESLAKDQESGLIFLFSNFYIFLL
jgi:hypothetical protein